MPREMACSSATGASQLSTILAYARRDDHRQWASLAWEIHGGPMTTPEGDLVKDPQQPSGRVKMPQRMSTAVW